MSTPVGPGDPAAPSTPAPVLSSTPAGAPVGDDALVGADASWRQRRRTRQAAKRANRRKAPWWELPALILLAIVIAIVVKTFVVQPFYIPSQSMEKTLHGCPGCHGDRILVNKPIFDFRDPEPGDIVVFNAPKGWDDEPISRPPSNPVVRAVRGFGQLIGFVPPDGQVLVKRVIATGGQTVKGDSAGHVLVSTHGASGPYRTLREPYVFIDRGQLANVRPFGPVTVPKGRLWVMGDHRNDSADSRYHCGPDGVSDDQLNCGQYPTEATVPIGDVIGKAFVIAWPPSRWRTLGTPSTFDQAGGVPLVGVRGAGAGALPGAGSGARSGTVFGAASGALPGAAAVGVVAPLFLLRRARRLRRRHRRRPRGR